MLNGHVQMKLSWSALDVSCTHTSYRQLYTENTLAWLIQVWLNLTFIGPCIANIFAKFNQQDASFHNLFISVRRSTCFRRFFRPSSRAQNCTYSIRYWSDKYLTLYVQFWAPDDGQKNHLKHVERLTEINNWVKRDQLDVTCSIISLLNAQHVSDVNTSILRSLWLTWWVITWVALTWFDVCWSYIVVWYITT